MKKSLVTVVLLLVAIAAGAREKEHSLHVLSINDVHGAYFNRSYADSSLRCGLPSVKWYIDSIRAAVGAENVLLVDVGDILQGDNAAYYYNYVATDKPHIVPRMASYMGYDALVVGNHDIEAGHPVYDRIRRDLVQYGIPFLAGNAIDENDGSHYFEYYKIYEKAGLKVLLLGYTNPSIKSWVQEERWKGIDFKSLIPMVQEDVDRLRARFKPQVVIVAAHSGSGPEDGSSLESQGRFLLHSLSGVDLILTSHDHIAAVDSCGAVFMANGGSKARYLTSSVINVRTRGRKVVSRHSGAELIEVSPLKSDADMEAAFLPDWKEVRDFSQKPVGELGMDILTRESFAGQSDYTNLIHTVQLSVPEAKLSIAAPLTYNRRIRKGPLVLDDMSVIYPYENQLFVVNMTGSEIKNYLEYSYGRWLSSEEGHVLNISLFSNPANGTGSWRFNVPSYDLDSFAGLVYTVDVTKPFGSRISIESLADGTAFDSDAVYPVAMTSYRASGAGGLISEGAGINPSEIEGRVVARYLEIRDLIRDFIMEKGGIDAEVISNPDVIGSWRFVPESSREGIDADMSLLFRR